MNSLLDILLHPSHHHVLFPIFAILAILIYAFIGQVYVYFALVKMYDDPDIDSDFPKLLCCFMCGVWENDGKPFIIGALWPIFLTGAVTILIVIILLGIGFCVCFAIVWILDHAWLLLKWAYKLIFCGGLFKLITGKTLTPSDK